MKLPERLYTPATATLVVGALLGGIACSGTRAPSPVETLHAVPPAVDVSGDGLKEIPDGFNPLSIVGFGWASELYTKYGVSSAVKIDDAHILSIGAITFKQNGERRADCMETIVVGRNKADGPLVQGETSELAGEDTPANNISLLKLSEEDPIRRVPAVTVSKRFVTPPPGATLLLAHYGAAGDGHKRSPEFTPKSDENNTEKDYSEPGLHTLRVLGHDSTGHTIAIVAGKDLSRGAKGVGSGNVEGGGAVIDPYNGQLMGVLSRGFDEGPIPVKKIESAFAVDITGAREDDEFLVFNIQRVKQSTLDPYKKNLEPIKKC